jgi:hypothetical protein
VVPVPLLPLLLLVPFLPCLSFCFAENKIKISIQHRDDHDLLLCLVLTPSGGIGP